MLQKIFIKLTINILLLWLTARYVDGMTLSAHLGDILRVAVLFSLFNTFLKPVVNFLTLPFSLLTLGLFRLVVNAGMLWLVACNSTALNFVGSTTSAKLQSVGLATLIITAGGAVLGRLLEKS